MTQIGQCYTLWKHVWCLFSCRYFKHFYRFLKTDWILQAKLTSEKNMLASTVKKLSRDVLKVILEKLNDAWEFRSKLKWIVFVGKPLVMSPYDFLVFQLESFKKTLMHSLQEEDENQVVRCFLILNSTDIWSDTCNLNFGNSFILSAGN